jgi:hypothetical protein
LAFLRILAVLMGNEPPSSDFGAAGHAELEDGRLEMAARAVKPNHFLLFPPQSIVKEKQSIESKVLAFMG